MGTRPHRAHAKDVTSGDGVQTSPRGAPWRATEAARAAARSVSTWATAHRRALLEAAGVLVGFAILATVVTWPLVLHMNSLITSDGAGWDPAGYVWDLWFNSHHGLSLWGSSTRDSLSAPFGSSLAASANTTLFVTLGPAWVVAKLFGPVVAYNVCVLMGLTLTSASMYLLVRWLGLGPMPATWAGIALMFAPYQLLKATLHLPLVQLECFPLLILAGLCWLVKPGWVRALWMILALALAWLSNPYYGLMASVIIVVIGVVGLVRFLRSDGVGYAARRIGEAIALGLLLVAVPLAALMRSSQDALDTNFSRTRESLDVFGARLRDYVVPDGNNQFMDWLVGDARWTLTAAPGGERTIFLGWVALALAVAGVAIVALRRERIAPRVRLAVLVAVPSAVLLVWFSLASPSYIGGHRIPVPSEAIFDSFSFYRVYARFGIAVLVVVVLLAAIGLAEIARGRGPRTTWAIGVVAAAASVLLVAPALPVSTARPVTIAGGDPRDAPSWNWLRDQDPEHGIVFEYPTGTNAYGPQFESIERYWQYGQTIHGRTLLNGGFSPGELGYDFTRNVGRPEWPGVASQLAGAGVSTVTINPWAFGPLGQPPIDPAAPPAGYEMAKQFADGTAAWHVTADPDPASVIFRGTWSEPTPIGSRLWWAARFPSADLSVVGWTPGRYRLTFVVRAFGARAGSQLRVVGPQGVIAKVPLGTTPRKLSVTVVAGSTTDPLDLRMIPSLGKPKNGFFASAPTVEKLP